MFKKLMSFILTLSLCLGFGTTALAAQYDKGNNLSYWAEAEVKEAIGLGLVPSDLQGDYTDKIRREDFARLIAGLALAWNPGSSLESILADRGMELDIGAFSDSDSKEVAFCAALGIVNGDGKGNFSPEAPISRQEAAKMLYYAADSLTLLLIDSQQNSTGFRGIASWELPHSFEDGELIYSWARWPVSWCYRTGIMRGVGHSLFDAEGGYTTEQAILTVLRLYYAYGQEDKLSSATVRDLYPVFEEGAEGLSVSGWMDSSLGFVSKEEAGLEPEEYFSTEIYELEGRPAVDLGGGVYALKDSETRVTVIDSFGGTLSELTLTEPFEMFGSANGVLVIKLRETGFFRYFTQSGKALPF